MSIKKLLLLLLCGIFAVSLAGKSADALFDAHKSGEVIIPKGEYVLTETVKVTGGLRVVFAHGAVLRSKVTPVFCVTGGKLTIEGEGDGGVIHCSAGSDGIPAGVTATVIDLTGSTGKNPAAVCLRNMEFRADRGIDGVVKNNADGKLGPLEISKCRFYSKFRGVSIFNMELASCRITDSLFDGGIAAIFVCTSIPGGAYVCGNTVRNFGKSGIVLGKGGQIAEGITKCLPMATVHDNRLLRGGFAATVKDSYIHGILVYGHNVSVQGNIVRDVNRGVPVPGAKCGHQILENGKVFKERMRKVGKKQIRLAGSAIYLKANRAIVHSNICTNSGWRSVIEVKTGGKEFYTSVVNNVVDGRSLAVDDSFAFECNSGRSLWANNVVYDVPHQAFVVRCGYENTFMNNLIVNAKVGFALSGNPRGEKELINGNRFIDVLFPVALNGSKPHHAAGADIYRMPQAYIYSDMELPEPSAANAGRMIIRGKALFCCVRTEKGFVWMEINGRIVPEKRWQPSGKELAVNADQSGKGDIPAALAAPLHPGWLIKMATAREETIVPSGDNLSFDDKNFLTGGRSLKISFKNSTGLFHLRQNIKVVPGKRYRAKAVVKGDDPTTLTLSVRTNKGFAKSVRATEARKWQTLSFDFTVPAGDKVCTVAISGGKTGVGNCAWVDSISLQEMVEESVLRLRGKKSVGANLFKAALWKTGARKDVLTFENKNGMLTLISNQKTVNAVISQRINLQPQKSYRLQFEVRSDDVLPVSAYIKTNGRNISKSFNSGAAWQSCRFEFTVSGKKAIDVFGLWVGKIKLGKRVYFRNISCFELDK